MALGPEKHFAFIIGSYYVYICLFLKQVVESVAKCRDIYYISTIVFKFVYW